MFKIWTTSIDVLIDIFYETDSGLWVHRPFLKGLCCLIFGFWCRVLWIIFCALLAIVLSIPLYGYVLVSSFVLYWPLYCLSLYTAMFTPLVSSNFSIILWYICSLFINCIYLITPICFTTNIKHVLQSCYTCIYLAYVKLISIKLSLHVWANYKHITLSCYYL